MTRVLKPETLRKKALAVESLDAFLERMAAVWHARQAKLEVAPALHLAASKRSQAKRKAVDPEAFQQARRDAVAKYGQVHPERVSATQKRYRLRRKLSETDQEYQARSIKAAQRRLERIAEDPGWRQREAEQSRRSRKAQKLARGAGAERREGGEAPLSTAAFKATTWRAPWALGYALETREAAT